MINSLAGRDRVGDRAIVTPVWWDWHEKISLSRAYNTLKKEGWTILGCGRGPFIYPQVAFFQKNYKEEEIQGVMGFVFEDGDARVRWRGLFSGKNMWVSWHKLIFFA